MVHLVTAVIAAHRLEAVTDALRASGVQGMTIAEVHDTCAQPRVETYRGTQHRVDFAPMLKLETVCDTFDAEHLAAVIAAAARAGNGGGGTVWISPIDRFVSIRTNAADVEAI